MPGTDTVHAGQMFCDLCYFRPTIVEFKVAADLGDASSAAWIASPTCSEIRPLRDWNVVSRYFVITCWLLTPSFVTNEMLHLDPFASSNSATYFFAASATLS